MPNTLYKNSCKISKQVIVLLIFGFALAFKVSAQSNYGGLPFIKNHQKSEYNAATQNWAITQDKKGVLYFGNNEGVLIFDGMNWETLPVTNFSVVRSLAIDKNENIWVGSFNEIGFLQKNSIGKREYVSIIDLIPDKHKNFGDVWKIHTTKHGIYFQTFSYIFFYDFNKIEIISSKGNYQFSFYIDKRFFIQDKSKGLMELRGKKLFLLQGGEIFINKMEVWSMLKLDNDQILIATQQDGLFVYDGYKISKHQSKIEKFLIKNQVFSSLKLANGNILFGTIQSGVIIIDKEGNLIQHINKNKGLQNNTILSSFIDANGQLWLGLDNGIDYLEINSPFSYINDGSGIEGTGYTSKRHNGYLYLGTNQGLYYKNLKGARSQNFSLIENTKGQVWSLYEIDNSLFCGHNKGTFIIDKNKAKQISDEPGAWMFLKTTMPDKIIAGTYTSLISFRKNKPATWSFEKKYEKINESCRILASDSLNNLWISHEYKGIIKVNFSADYEKINYFKLYNTNNGFRSGFDLYAYKFNNDLIFCSDSGIYKYDYQADYFYLTDKYDKLFGKGGKIRIPKKNKAGDVWFFKNGTPTLLKHKTDGTFTTKKRMFSRFKNRFIDGFEHIEFIDSTSVLIGTDAGFIHYRNNFISKTTDSLQTIISLVKITKPSDSIVAYGYISATDNKIDENSFPYQMNALKFEFTLPFYEGVEQTEYRFKLEGFDKSWSQWKTVNEKEYTNLAPGQYSFKVVSKTVFGRTSKENRYNFTILPPWYKTFWVYLFYLLFTIGLIALISILLNIRLQKERQKLLERQKRELKEKEEKFAKEVLLAEKQIIKLENEKLQIEVNSKKADMELKNKELASVAIQINRKDEMLTKLKKDLEIVAKGINPESRVELNQLIRNIDSDIKLDEDWNNFTKHFEEVHYDFFKRLKKNYPSLTPKDLKLCAYLRINLSTKEIAPLLNISVRGVEISRYRLRKKLEIDKDVNLIDFMLEI